MHSEFFLSKQTRCAVYHTVWPAQGCVYEQRKADVFICHGLGEHIGRYQKAAAALAKAGYTVHGMDHQGHGRCTLIPAVPFLCTPQHRHTAAARHPGCTPQHRHAPQSVSPWLRRCRSRCRSEGERCHIERFDHMVSDYLQFVELVRGPVASPSVSPPAFLLGHSMGGLIAINVARQSEKVLRLFLWLRGRVVRALSLLLN